MMTSLAGIGLSAQYTWLPSTVQWIKSWRHNERVGISSHRRPHCLLNCCVRRRSKETLGLRVTGLCAGNLSVTGECPAQKASDAEMFPIYDVIMSNAWNPCTPLFKSNRNFFLQCQKVVLKFKISICNFVGFYYEVFWYEQLKFRDISFVRLVSVVV